MIDHELHEEFSEWVADTAHRHVCNKWLTTGTYASVYVRRSVRSFQGTLRPFVDIARITVHPQCQNQGVFRAFLAHAEELCPRLYIENTLTPRFRSFFRKRPGYVQADWCFYRVVGDVEVVHANLSSLR